MFNTALFTTRNILVICAFALMWQIIFSRAHSFMHAPEASGVTV